jgi:hypothetical protein
MAQQTINIGTAQNDGTGTPLRTAFDYCNLNFTELYTAVGPSGNNIVVPGTATITGNLTVDTNTLFVDAANNRVTVGTSSAYGKLTVGVGSGSQTTTITNVAAGLIDIDFTSSGTINTRFSFVNASGVTNAAIDRIGNPSLSDSGNLAFLTRSGSGSLTERYRIAADGVATWSEVGGVAGTAMTLNSTGLLVGTNATGYGAAGRGLVVAGGSTSAILALRLTSGDSGYLLGDATKIELGSNGLVPLTLNNGGVRMTIDTSGNVGVGVTPRAWATGYRALNVGIYTGLTDAQGGATYLTNNAYYDTTDSRWEAVTNNRALRYDQDTADGGHKWYSAPSVAANAALVWSNPMILDASGNLIWSPASTPPTLATNGQLTVNATSNTNLRFSYRGSDGTTRVANITLA